MFEEFKNLTLGKAIDVDGNWGPQCVDLFNYFNDLYNNGERINCLPSRYAYSIAENKANNGILKNFNETQVNNMIEGTVVIYGKCKFAPNGHVCFFIKDNGDGTYQALQQNAGNRRFVTIDNNPYSGIIGAFIPKQIQEEFNRKLEEERKAQEVQVQPEPTPVVNPLQVGVRVRTIGTGNASSYGDKGTASRGYEGTISRIIEDRAYPYCVNDNEGPIGWYKAEDLQVL